jgi:hypothetical protein
MSERVRAHVRHARERAGRRMVARAFRLIFSLLFVLIQGNTLSCLSRGTLF